jgi:deoxycytidine triphosphate deaminase
MPTRDDVSDKGSPNALNVAAHIPAVPHRLARDPDASKAAGILLSDRIAFYAEHPDLRLIEPFDPSRLRPAAYELTLGQAYHLRRTEDDDSGRRIALAPDEQLLIHPHAIVYTTVKEQLNMPFYLVGRINLKMNLMAQGLLLGTGIHIDPGFRGILSCPLYNFSSKTVIITRDEPFIIIEFMKTTPFAESMSDEQVCRNEDELRKLGEARQLLGLSHEGRVYPCVTYDSKKLSARATRDPLYGHFRPADAAYSIFAHHAEVIQERLQWAKDHAAEIEKELNAQKSMLEQQRAQMDEHIKGQLSAQLERVDERVDRTVRHFNFGSLIAVGAVALTLVSVLGVILSGYFATVRESHATAESTLNQIHLAEQKRDDLETRLRKLEQASAAGQSSGRSQVRPRPTP